MDGKEGAGGKGRVGLMHLSPFKINTKKRENPALKAHYICNFSPL